MEAAKADIVGVEGIKPGERVTERAIAKHVALFTMYRVLTEFLALLHPFMPHLTEELTERLSFPPRPAAPRPPTRCRTTPTFPRSPTRNRASPRAVRVS